MFNKIKKYLKKKYHILAFVIIFISLGFVTVYYYNPVEIKKVEVIKYIEKKGISINKFILKLNPKTDPFIAKEIEKSIAKYSKVYQLPEKLIISIIKKESSFNVLAKSNAGAIGLMQVLPRYHKDKIKKLGITNAQLYHIDENIHVGCLIFKTYIDQSKGDIDEAFHKYLSKSASKKTVNNYINNILCTWAKLDFMDYKHNLTKNVSK